MQYNYDNKIYNRFKVKIYDIVDYYNENTLYKSYKDNIINDLKNSKIIEMQDEFITEDEKKKEDINKLKKLFKRINVFDNYNNDESFTKCIKRLIIYNSEKESYIKETNFVKNKENKYEYTFVKNDADDIDNLKIRIYFDCFELTRKILLDFINNFIFKLEIGGNNIYNMNFFNFMFEFNNSIKINYDNKYIEFKLIRENLRLCSLFYHQINIYFDFNKFNYYKNFILYQELSLIDTSKRYYKNNHYYKTIEFHNYNNINKFINTFERSYSFLIYFKDIDYISDIKSISIITNTNKVIELNYDLFYIGEIPFYIVYTDNRISNIDNFINKYFKNLDKENEFISLKYEKIKKLDIKFYDNVSDYENKIAITNIFLNFLIYTDFMMGKIFYN